MFPMGMITPRMTAARWRSKQFTSSTTFVVPPDVGLLWLDACSGGGGGGGGYDGEGGGGGSGGSPAPSFCQVPFPVIPGETLTVTVGAGGAGGAKGSVGAEGGYTVLTGRLRKFVGERGYGGGNGAVAAGGGGNSYPNDAYSAHVGPPVNPGGYGWPFFEHNFMVTAGGSGGAPSANGSGQFCVMPPNTYTGGGAGNATGGGGGVGGCCYLCPDMAYGGAGGSAGADATGYGGGGAGGGGNAAGGAGSNGMILLCMLTAYEI